MENFNVFVVGDNQVNEEKPPPRVCPRCNSDNTKFCYYNNYSVSQPRYNCRNCRRYWTHGGALRNIPIGGSGRKIKRTRIDQPSDSQVVSVEIQQVNHQQVNHHQPFLHVQETNEFVGFSCGSSSSSVAAVGNHFSSLPRMHGDMVLPTRSFRPMDRSDFNDRSIQQDYYDAGSNGLIGNPLINQSIGGSVVVSSDQEDQNKWNQSFNNIMNMNHASTSTSGSRGYLGTDHMNKANGKTIDNCVFKSSYHLEKHGP